MPNDPKWRSIARASRQSIGNVLAVYLHVLVDASNASERGRTHPNAEDIASALDCDEEVVSSILSAMQGRVLDGNLVTGWAKRQPAREDGSAERARAWREAKKAESMQPNASERTQTQSNAREEKSREDKTRVEKKEAKASVATFVAPEWVPSEAWQDFITMRKAIRGVPFTEAAAKGVVREMEKLCAEGFDATDLLQSAVTNGWRTVYRPKGAQAVGGKVLNKQEALEARNRQVAADWVRDKQREMGMGA